MDNKHLITLVGAASLALPGMALAAENTENALEEVVITGLKRAENLQETAVAATVIGGDALASRGIERIDDLQTIAPSLSITDAGLTQSVNIRGVGLASGSPNAANGVATYYDGVFQPPIVTTNSFYDIQSVEVFRGPQGTFVGSNSTGGAIFINSRDPSLAGVDGYFQGELGNYSRKVAEGAINLPVGETLAIRAAGIYRSRDSFYKQTAGIEPPASLDEAAVRLGLLWQPTDSFSALLKAEAADKQTGGYAYRPIPGTRYAPFRTDDPYTLNYSDATRNDEMADQVTGRLEYRTAGGTTFRSISGYQNKRIYNEYDSDGTDAASLPRSTQNQFVRERVWTEEVNVLSPDDGDLSWIVGGYYQKNRIDVAIVNNPTVPVHTTIDIQNRKITTGVFGQVTYDFSPEWSLDAGVRQSNYKVDGSGAVQLVRPAPATALFLADPGGKEKDDQVTGKLGLNWKPSADHLAYVFVAKGYKSGGFASPTTTFLPETVVDVEAGWKGSFADGKVTFQLGAFHYDYKNFQLDVINAETGRSSLINLTNAKVKGVEAQFQADLSGLRLSGGLGYTDSSLSGTDFVDVRGFAVAFPGVSNAPQCPAGQPSNPPACVDYAPFIQSTAGGPNLFSPKLTYNLSAEYPFELGGIPVAPYVSLAHVGPRYTYIAYEPQRDRLSSYEVINGGISLTFERFDAELWATNLGGSVYTTGQNSTNEFYGAPREYGVRFKVRF